MPALERSDLNQRCLYWPFSGYDAFGQPTVSTTPTEIPCRWVWTHREAVDAKGNTIALDADIALALSPHVGAHLWLGTLEQWNGTGSGSATVDQDLCEVQLSKNVPDVKGRVHRYTVSVMRLHDKQGTSD